MANVMGLLSSIENQKQESKEKSNVGDYSQGEEVGGMINQSKSKFLLMLYGIVAAAVKSNSPQGTTLMTMLTSTSRVRERHNY